MKKQLIEIAKGSTKGLVGAICCAPFGIGLPAADGLYASINSKEGKIAHDAVYVGLITAAAVTLYNVIIS